MHNGDLLHSYWFIVSLLHQFLNHVQGECLMQKLFLFARLLFPVFFSFVVVCLFVCFSPYGVLGCL